MSWLFDQLAELAVADRVEIVVGVELKEQPAKPGSIDVIELVLRTARLPRTTLIVLPADLTEPTLPLTDADTIDIDTINVKQRGHAVAFMLADHRRHCGAVLRVHEGRMSLEPYGQLPAREVRATNPSDGGTVGWMYADRACFSDADDLDEVAASGLRISIGSLSPTANVIIADESGFVSVLDALVTLREFALEPALTSTRAQH